MASEGTFEERIGDSLDALFDGAELLTRESLRAEKLVLSVVVEAARSHPRGPGEAVDFRKWILGRMVRQYVEYAEGDVLGEAEEDRASGEGSASVAPEEVPEGEAGSAVESLLTNLSTLDRSAPDRLGVLIRSAMRELRLYDRAALWLVNVMDFSYAEAARSLGIGPAALRRTLRRARKELQLRLAGALQAELGRAPRRDGTGERGA